MKKIFTAVTNTVETASIVINDTLSAVQVLSKVGTIYAETLAYEAKADSGMTMLDTDKRVLIHKLQHDKDVAELKATPAT